MKISVPKETAGGETRVALIPASLPALLKEKHEVVVETGAGIASSFSDEQYTQAGAQVAPDVASLYNGADLLLKVQPPRESEARLIKENSTYIGFLAPLVNTEVVRIFVQRRITGFSVEYIPRITRAQGMDALSSMANIGGYKAVLIAAEKIGKMFPMMMTAAGTILPATVLVLGAGVAGLQAIATAKRLGAKVEAFDPRPAVKEQVKSLGASFIEMELPKDAETAGGYAKELSPGFIKKEMEAIGGRLPKVDVVICTAQVFGKKAPLLITADMVRMLKRGSVIVDLAAEQGGNCELTRAGETVDHDGVKIVGAVNLPATVPADASQMYSKNITNLLKLLYPTAGATPDFNDEVIKGACIIRNGEILNESIRAAVQQGGGKS